MGISRQILPFLLSIFTLNFKWNKFHMELYFFSLDIVNGGSKLNYQGDIVANIKRRKIQTYMYIISVCNYPLSKITWTLPPMLYVYK